MTFRFLFFLMAFTGTLLPLSAAPSVSNVRAAQRAGTNLVDVYYDLADAGVSGPAQVSLSLSGDGGTTYGLPISSAVGAIGDGVGNGLNHHIVWDAGTDQPNFASALMRFRVTASSAQPVPASFVLIPAGSFIMGDSSDGNTLWISHTISIPNFYLGKTEVTKAIWDEVRDWGLVHGYSDLAVGAGKAATHPVHSVSWFDVVKWCNAASEKAGLAPCYLVASEIYRVGDQAPTVNYLADGYRLPTEAEWEKGARGGGLWAVVSLGVIAFLIIRPIIIV